MTRLIKWPVILISLAFFYVGGCQAQQHQLHAADNRFGSHGMVLLTDGTYWYASHMPLYRRPHDVQLIYKIDIAEAHSKLIKAGSQGLISLLPDNFDLELLIAGQTLEINADVFQGHFERGGELWLDDITIRFAERLYLRSLHSEQLRDSDSPVVYDSLELSGEHLLLIRQITKAPSVDNLLLLSVNDSAIGMKSAVSADKCLEPQELLAVGLSNVTAKSPDLRGIQAMLSDCFDIKESYWETADFAQ